MTRVFDNQFQVESGSRITFQASLQSYAYADRLAN